VFHLIEAARGWPEGTLPRGPFTRNGDPEYAKCSTGELTESEYWSAFEASARARGFPIDLHRSIDWSQELRPEVLETVESLHGVFFQATLSNDSSTWLGDDWWETWPYRHLFEAVVDVKMLGLRKPHPDTYLTVASRLRMAPEQCLFIDDMQVNIDGALQVGMEGFFFDHTDPVRSCRQLIRRVGGR